MNRRLTALTLTAVALFGLTACTGSPAANEGTADAGASSAPASDQSVADACTQVNDVMTEATADLQEIDPNDPANAATALRTISEGMSDAAAAVTNAEVAGVLPDLQAAFASAADSMEAVAGGDTERATELNTALTDVQASFTEFQELCGTPGTE